MRLSGWDAASAATLCFCCLPTDSTHVYTRLIVASSSQELDLTGSREFLTRESAEELLAPMLSPGAKISKARAWGGGAARRLVGGSGLLGCGLRRCC